jgi:methylated-DNA-[protein]-cysteine S-methyltransferase
VKLVEIPIVTPRGKFIAFYSEAGLAELNFPVNGRAVPALRDQDARQRTPTNTLPARFRRWHGITETALKNALAGRAPKNLPPLDPAGTAFQKSVWRALRKIPSGQTKSYGEIARALGRPKAVRAVGGACGANPIPIFIPCHRVLAANGKIGGFSGGLNWKRDLLAREGMIFRQGGVAAPPGLMAAQRRGPTFDFRPSVG